MFNDTVTLFNCYIDPQTRKEAWNKTILKCCMWRKKTVKTVANGKIQIDDAISLTIPYRDSYVAPRQYEKLPTEEMLKYWTLNADSNKDIVVLGEVVETIDSNYTIASLRKDYDVFTLASVSDNTLVDCLKNWKVTAK